MRIVTIACWLVTALALAGVAVWFLTGTVFGMGQGGWNANWLTGFGIGGWALFSGPYSEATEYSHGTAGVESLNIDWVAGEVTVKPYDGSDFKITESAQRGLDENERLQISESGGTLTIKYARRNGLLRLPPKKLEVLVPQALSENLGALSADTVSSPVVIEGIGADTLKANSTSGSIRISNCAAQALSMKSTSGSLTMAGVHADSMNIGSTSGAIHISGSSAKTLDCSTTSGRADVSGAFDSVKQGSVSGRLLLDNTAPASDLEANSTSGALELSGSFDKVNAKSVSGRLDIRSTILPGSLKANTTSGSINIAIPGEAAVTVDHSSVSGSFSSAVPVIMQKTGAQFKLSSISGSIRINQMNNTLK